MELADLAMVNFIRLRLYAAFPVSLLDLIQFNLMHPTTTRNLLRIFFKLYYHKTFLSFATDNKTTF